MIRDAAKWRAWEDAYRASQPIDFEANLRFAEAALAHARELGAFPPADPLEGIEHKIALARIINCSPNSYKTPPGR